MKHVLLLFALFISTYAATGQYTDAIKRDAASYNQAYLDGDYDTYVDRSIPHIVRLGGGKASMISVAKEQSEMYAANNMQIETIIPEATGDLFQSEGAMHVVLGQRQVMRIGDKRFESIVSYLAESTDEGQTWTFIDLSAYDKESLLLFLPGVSPDIVLPAPQEAMLIKE